jgi:DNA polymerase-3 subunit alpha
MEIFNKETNDEEFYKKIINWLYQIRDIFGEGNFFLEMQPSKDKEQVYVNRQIIKLSQLTGIPYIITTDSHYLNLADAPLHEAFLKAQDGDREVSSFYQTTYLMGTEELESFMNDYFTIALSKINSTTLLNVRDASI